MKRFPFGKVVFMSINKINSVNGINEYAKMNPLLELGDSNGFANLVHITTNGQFSGYLL